MAETKRVLVLTQMDAITLRMRIREMAHVMGFDIKDQACISLAAWALIKALGLGKTCRGEVRNDVYPSTV